MWKVDNLSNDRTQEILLTIMCDFVNEFKDAFTVIPSDGPIFRVATEPADLFNIQRYIRKYSLLINMRGNRVGEENVKTLFSIQGQYLQNKCHELYAKCIDAVEYTKHTLSAYHVVD